nr:prolyl 4-hydroxylase 1 [Quercus suber]
MFNNEALTVTYLRFPAAPSRLSKMSNAQEQPFRWRTVLEVGVIAAVIYIVLGAPGLSSKTAGSSAKDGQQDVPISKAKIESLVFPRADLQCPQPQYDVHVFSTSPLVLYVDNFVTEAEADHLVDISNDKWQVSTVFNAGVEAADPSVRKSEKALIARDPAVQCIETRALAFQGWPEQTFIEQLWTQRYNVSGHYAHHYDWGTASRNSYRVSTFMVYLSADCEGGGTNFPRLMRPKGKQWCEYVECDGKDEGVTFKARKGAAVFWRNFGEDGKGAKETIHAGMPVTTGTKIGLNIWSWYQADYVPDG